ncbi:MFS transporter [Glutamicibacter sp.]|uniref:MFS transporter n=1 Tax=Glutamicibacter sp. TaxID=1931995 RepID=UPI0028BDF591|nr:MFS transporter [Glutamicibacter sp.]
MPTSSLSNRARLTPKVIGGFIGSGVISLVAANFVPVFMSGMTNDLGFSLGNAGLVATGMSLASVAAMWISNLFVATRSRALIALIGIAAMVAGFGTAALFYTAAGVCIGLLIAGAGCGVMGAASMAAVSSTENPDRATTVVAVINRAAVSALFLLAPIYFNDLRQVFVVLCILGLVGATLVRGLPNMPQGLLSHKSSEPTDRVAALRPVGIVLALAFGAWSMTEDMVYSLTSAVLGIHAGLSEEASTSMLAYKVLGGLLGTVLAPLALKKFGRPASILGIVAVSTITKYLMITTTTPWVYMTSIVVWGIVYIAIVILVLGLASSIDISGRTGVFVNSIYVIGIALGPMVGGRLQPTMTFSAYALLVCLPAVIFGLVIAYIARRCQHNERTTTARQTNAAVNS